MSGLDRLLGRAHRQYRHVSKVRLEMLLCTAQVLQSRSTAISVIIVHLLGGLWSAVAFKAFSGTSEHAMCITRSGAKVVGTLVLVGCQ